MKRGRDMLLSVKAIEASKGGFSFSCLAKKMCKGVELILALQINESQMKRLYLQNCNKGKLLDNNVHH